jgi:hypothetical protein
MKHIIRRPRRGFPGTGLPLRATEPPLMPTFNGPQGTRVTVHTSNRPAGSRKAKTVIVSVKGRPGSRRK